MTTEKLQVIINEAQRLREESWNEKTATYSYSMKQASEAACLKHKAGTWLNVVYLLNQTAWNDAQDIVTL